MSSRLGQTLRQLRKATGYTLEDVAKAADISPAALSLFETGKRNPSPKVLGTIAAFFDYPVEPLQLLLDEERYAGRLEEAQYWQDSSGRVRQADDRSGPMRANSASISPSSARVFSPQPIENLFFGEPRSAEEAPPVEVWSDAPSDRVGTFGLTGPQPVEHTRMLRHAARQHDDSAMRLYALEELGDQASLALRTIRGLVDDEDAAVSREARRVLRELGLDVPTEKSEAEGDTR